MSKRVAVAFTGPSNSGKTTLIEKISNILVSQKRVAIIKHDPKDKAMFDTKGKDSDRFSKTGAEVIVSSPLRTTYLSQRQKSLKEMIDMLDTFDILLVEGLKTLKLPRIAIFRGEIDISYLDCSESIAIDGTIDIDRYDIPTHIEVLDLNNPHQIIEWIDNNAKSV